MEESEKNDFNLSKSDGFGDLYENAVKGLMIKLESTGTIQSGIMPDFAKKYTLLPDLWKYWFLQEKRQYHQELVSMNNIHFKILGYMISERAGSFSDEFYLNHFNGGKMLEEMFLFSQNRTPNIFHEFKKCSTSYIYPAKFNDEEWYNSLIKVQKNDELWLEKIKETNDAEFISKSWEYRLGERPIGQYQSNKAMKEVLTDIYKVDIVLGDDYFENLKTFKSVIESNEFIVAKDEVHNAKGSIVIPTTLTPGIYQRFPFKNKLQMSCKELYFKKEILYCHRLSIREIQNTIYSGNALMISSKALQTMDLLNYHLVNSLDVMLFQGFNGSNPTILSTLLSKIQFCSIRYLTVYNQNITFEEFKFLASSLEHIFLKNVSITKNDGTNASIEEIIEHLPSASDLTLNMSFTSDQNIKISIFKRVAKFKQLTLSNLPYLDVEDFAAFVMKNAESVISLDIRFVDPFEGLRFRIIIKELQHQLKMQHST
uniref:Uncharacterized protein n=1 Tax=Panagrolaimus sp. ES5 TaxID=591445 RepID=A0AC34F884_9BILA